MIQNSSIHLYQTYHDLMYFQNEINYHYNKIYVNSFFEILDRQLQSISNCFIPYDKNTKTKEYVYNFYDDWIAAAGKYFNQEMKSEKFLQILAQYTDTASEVISTGKKIENMTGIPLSSVPEYYHHLYDWYYKEIYSASMSQSKEENMAPYEIVFEDCGKRLLHYHSHQNNFLNYKNANEEGTGHDNKQQQQEPGSDCNYMRNEHNLGKREPLLIIYAPINRFHILDLNPQKSVVRNLISNNMDVYLLDWGFPSSPKDNNITLKDYVDYIDRSVDIIISKNLGKGIEKVSILGYCWGGIVSLIYSSLKQEKIKKLILMATPVDFSKDNTTVAKWSKAVNIDKLVDNFGHFDGSLLDFIFHMRNPSQYIFDKYFRLFKNPPSKESMDTFKDVEKWLHDTPPIPGKMYKKIINDCYKGNLLIVSEMELEDSHDDQGQEIAEEEKKSKEIKNIIDIRKINIPLLSIIADKDTLVSKESSLAINNYIQSEEKEVFTISSGHVALCIGKTAHQNLWPKVAKWIKK